MLRVLEMIDQADTDFQSVTEPVDTTTSAGRMMHMVCSLADFERSLLRERTCVSSDEALRVGRVGGRRPKLTQVQQQELTYLVFMPSRVLLAQRVCTKFIRQRSHDWLPSEQLRKATALKPPARKKAVAEEVGSK
ncbi:MAG: recombinase family protein [Granulosicoccus sp.]